MENKLITLYLVICHLYDTKPVLKQQRLSNNHRPLFSDEELLTIYLFGHMQGLTTQRHIYDYTRHHWRRWFPRLPAYQSFNYRLNQLIPAFELLIEELLGSQAWQIAATDDRLIDSMPVMLARGSRANRGRVAPDLADTGFCATKQHITGALSFISSRPVGLLGYPYRRRFIFHRLRSMTCQLCAKSRRPCHKVVDCSPTKPTFTPTRQMIARNLAGIS